MRDYSKPFYDLSEISAAFNGVCKCLGKEEYCCESTMPMLGNQISALARIMGIDISPTGDLGTSGMNLQRLIESLIDKGVRTREQLRACIDPELMELSHHPLINYFEG